MSIFENALKFGAFKSVTTLIQLKSDMAILKHSTLSHDQLDMPHCGDGM